MLDITVIGSGSISQGVRDALAGDKYVRIAQVVTSSRGAPAARNAFADCSVATRVDALPRQPELILECAGHSAVVEHVMPALEQGIDCIICSIGALAQPKLVTQLQKAALVGQAQLQLISGAMGGIDALAAASIGGLEEVIYTGRKPPHAWADTPAENKLDLDVVSEATTFFSGTARQAAQLFPKNANVAATVALAGLGLDGTQVALIADPKVGRNQHQIQARGAFGELTLQLAGFPLPSNPKTSALTVYSAARALHNRASPIVI